MPILCSFDQLERIRTYAEALLTPGEIALLLGLPNAQRSLFEEMCRNHRNHPVYEAYQQGKLTTKLALRQKIIKLAAAGSPAAQPLAEKMIKEQAQRE